jgi:cell shape-determining protein MreD
MVLFNKILNKTTLKISVYKYFVYGLVCDCYLTRLMCHEIIIFTIYLYIILFNQKVLIYINNNRSDFVYIFIEFS